jgi:hypothetical protein
MPFEKPVKMSVSGELRKNQKKKPDADIRFS